MINEFVPYDIALAMKELGFNQRCFRCFDNEDHSKMHKSKRGYKGQYDYVLAPLYQQAFRWFREEYKLFSEVNLTTKQENVESFEFFVLNVNEPLFESDDYTVYEEAELACLKKLIEIVNQNKDECN